MLARAVTSRAHPLYKKRATIIEVSLTNIEPIISSMATTRVRDEGNEQYTDSSSNYSEYWIDLFLGVKGNEYFCDIDDDYIRDRFNLTGLSQEVSKMTTLVDIITDMIELDQQDEEHRDAYEQNARVLYGLIHARYILTQRGLLKMFEKYKKGDFGYCPRVHCQLNPLLPIGLNDQPRINSVKLYCARCEDLYNPKLGRHSVVDGAYFGTSFPAMFFMNYPHAIPVHNRETYVPRVFGFKVHEASKLDRWRNLQRAKLEKRLTTLGMNINNTPGGFMDASEEKIPAGTPFRE